MPLNPDLSKKKYLFTLLIPLSNWENLKDTQLQYDFYFLFSVLLHIFKIMLKHLLKAKAWDLPRIESHLSEDLFSFELVAK